MFASGKRFNPQIFYNKTAFLVDLLKVSLEKGVLREVRKVDFRCLKTYPLLKSSMIVSRTKLL